MKILIQVVLVGVTSVLYSHTIGYNYKTLEIKDKKPDDISMFVSEFSVLRLVEDEIVKQKQEKVVAELELHRENERQKALEQIERDKVKKSSRGSSRSVPSSDTSRKTYMDYRKITSKSSPQYKLQRSEDVCTDSNGYRMLGDRFIVAVGTYYTDKVGSELVIELDNGERIDAILGDVKADIHTDSRNQQHKIDGSVVEFLVDSKVLETIVKKMGDCSYSEANNFKGNIKSITVFESN